MNDRELDRLLIRISHGDEEAFAQLYITTKNGVYSFLYPYFNNTYDTEDAMQTVYLKIRTNIASYRKQSNGRAWILQIAKNTALNEIREQKKLIYTNLPIESKQRVSLQKGSTFEAMQKVLTSEEHEIVVLHVLWGYKHQEIAKSKNCPIGTITSKYKRALEKLQKELRED